MEISKKAWVIVYRCNGSQIELLLLKPNPEPGLVYDYYVVTGGVEEGETPAKAATRETQEEIGVKPINIFSLNETFEYYDKRSNQKVIEYCFAVEIDNSKLVLNEEHIDYKWVSIEDFQKIIWWEGSQTKLNNIIKTLEEISQKVIKKSDTVQKNSAGGVVYCDGKVLAIKVLRENEVIFPKGTIEAGETPEQTAIREVYEETGYKTKIKGSLGTEYYEYDEDNQHFGKTVYHYLLELIDKNLEPTPHREVGENFENLWLSIDEAFKTLTFILNRETLSKAVVLINNTL